MSPSVRLRLPVDASSRRRGSAPTLRSRPSNDVITRRALVTGGAILAALMVILSAQSTSARSAPEPMPETVAATAIVETAPL